MGDSIDRAWSVSDGIIAVKIGIIIPPCPVVVVAIGMGIVSPACIAGADKQGRGEVTAAVAMPVSIAGRSAEGRIIGIVCAGGDSQGDCDGPWEYFFDHGAMTADFDQLFDGVLRMIFSARCRMD
jgi:hypothetical protein